MIERIEVNVRFREKRTLGLASAVKFAEAIALGRKQIFIPRPRSPVYRRRYPVGGSLSYSDSGFDLRINCLGQSCGTFAGETRLRSLYIGGGILLTALCRTQAGSVFDILKRYRLTDGELRGLPILGRT